MSDTRLDHARDVLRLEADAVRAQIDQLGAPFLAACDLLLATRGHIIVTGLGKSGHIGEKIAATLASTGTPAFFVHAAEAGHGDLGMITGDDTILAISYSGESQEILMMLPIVRALGVKTIAITGRPQSALAQQADLHLPIIIEKEACPLGLAPTTSTTATLALGDALAITLMQARQFNEQDFARSHPYGRLGRTPAYKPRSFKSPTKGWASHWSATATACSASSPTATCAARWKNTRTPYNAPSPQ